MLPKRRARNERPSRRPAVLRIKPVSKDEVKKLKREIKRFNNQVSLAEKTVSAKIPSILPKRIKISKDISRTEIEDIRSKMRFVRSYLDLSPVEFGTRIVTRADKARIQHKERRVNLKAKKLLESVTLKAAEVGRFPTENSLLIQQIGLRNADPYNYERLLEWLSTDKARNSSEQWRQNYLRALDRQLEQMVNTGMVGQDFYYARDLNQRIYKMIAEMPVSDFLVAQLAYGGEVTIGFIYPLDEFIPRLERIEEAWQRVI